MGAPTPADAPFLLPVTSGTSPLLEAGPDSQELSLRGLCLTRQQSDGQVCLSVLLARRPKRGPQHAERIDFPLGLNGELGRASASLVHEKTGRWQVLVPHKLRVELDPRRVGALELEDFLSVFLDAAHAAADGSAAPTTTAFPSPEQADLAGKRLLDATAVKRSFGTGRASALGGFRPTNTLNSNSSAAGGSNGPLRSPTPVAQRGGGLARGLGLQAGGAGSPKASSPGCAVRPSPYAPPAAMSRAGYGRRMLQAAMGVRPPASSAGGALPLARGRGEHDGRIPGRISGPGFRGPQANVRPELGPFQPLRAPAHAAQIAIRSAVKAPYADAPRGGAGFRNIGNTCYMSAVLAALMGLPTFVDDLLDEQVFRRLGAHLPGDGTASGGSVYGAFWALATEYRQQRRRALAAGGGGRRGGGGAEAAVPVTPRKLKEALAKRAPHFANDGQQDASEFFSLALDGLAEEMRLAEARVRGLAGPPPPGTPLRPLAVDLNFGGELVKRMRCAGCGHSWTRTEGFSALSLQLPAAGGADPPTVQQLVEAHFAPAQIEVTCERCSGSHATLTHRLTRLPRILPIHLMRFDFSGRAIVKRSDPATPSRRLSLAFLTDPAAEAPPPPLGAAAASAPAESATALGAAQLVPGKARTPVTTRAPDAAKKRSFQQSLEESAASGDGSPPSLLAPPPTSAIAAAAPPRGGAGSRGAAPQGSRVPAASVMAAAQPVGRSRGGGRDHVSARGGGRLSRPASLAEEEEMIRRAIAESLAPTPPAGSASPRAARRRQGAISVDAVDISGAEGVDILADIISLDEFDDSQLVVLDEPMAEGDDAGEPRDVSGSDGSAQPAKRSRADPPEAPALTQENSNTPLASLPSFSEDTVIESTPPMATPPDVSSPASQLSEEAAIAAAIAASLADSPGDAGGVARHATAIAHTAAAAADAELRREARAAKAASAAWPIAAGSGLRASDAMDLDAPLVEPPHRATPAGGSIAAGVAAAGGLPRAATSYSLQSVVWHKGAAAAFGHYLADVRVPQEEEDERGWERYDDAFVTRIPAAAAIGIRAPAVNNGYLFFYTCDALQSAR